MRTGSAPGSGHAVSASGAGPNSGASTPEAWQVQARSSWGPQLLAALETAIEAGHVGIGRAVRLLGLPSLAVRCAQRLSRKLAC